jgi:hypothetical protein
MALQPPAMREATADELQTVDGGFWGTILGLLRPAVKLDDRGKDLESNERLLNFEIQN